MSDVAKRVLGEALAAAAAQPKWSARLQAQAMVLVCAEHVEELLECGDRVATVCQREVAAVAALSALSACTAALQSSGMSRAQAAATIAELLK